MNEHSNDSNVSPGDAPPDTSDIEYSNVPDSEVTPQETQEIDEKVVPVVAAVTRDELTGEEAEGAMRQMSRRGFLWSAFAVGSVYGTYRWLGSRREVDGLSWPLRQSHELNVQILQEFLPPSRLAPTFARHQVSVPRVNGDIGLDTWLFNAATWKLSVKGLASGENASLSLADIQKLPRVEMTTELKCIEGWSMIVHWAGARFADFAKKYAPQPDASFVGLSTPDEIYYVGLDMATAMHPQTLLCYEMNGAPLTMEHGAPLRLVTPLKYGIKNIKRIGTIEYSNRRANDYWAERGYDWYSGI